LELVVPAKKNKKTPKWNLYLLAEPNSNT
jgi:hypothetical protein